MAVAWGKNLTSCKLAAIHRNHRQFSRQAHSLGWINIPRFVSRGVRNGEKKREDGLAVAEVVRAAIKIRFYRDLAIMDRYWDPGIATRLNFRDTLAYTRIDNSRWLDHDYHHGSLSRVLLY